MPAGPAVPAVPAVSAVPVDHRLVGRTRTGAVVADSNRQLVIEIVELDVDGGAGRVPSSVGQRLLDDAVSGELDPGIEWPDAAADDQTRGRTGCVAGVIVAGLAIQQTRLRFDTAIGPWAGLGVLCGYAAVALVAALWLLRRRDA
jgi:hypothetical protein